VQAEEKRGSQRRQMGRQTGVKLSRMLARSSAARPQRYGPPWDVNGNRCRKLRAHLVGAGSAWWESGACAAQPAMTSSARQKEARAYG
jgi:hypothetical protein